MADKPSRTYLSAEQKVAILRRHLLEQVPVSQLCEEYKIDPSQFYRWQKALFENGASALERTAKPSTDPYERKIAALEEKLARKHEVVSELMEEVIKAKKANGEL
jgi:transposase-like protein